MILAHRRPPLPVNGRSRCEQQVQSHTYLTTGDGKQIYLKRDGRRVIVVGAYEQSLTGNDGITNEERPRITCAMRRGGQAIGRDILRRFLDDYLIALEHSRAYAVKRDREIRQRWHVEEALAEITGYTHRHEPNANGRRVIRLYNPYVEIEVHSASQISIEIPSIGDMETAAEVLAAVGQTQEKQAKR